MSQHADEIAFWSATELARSIRQRDVSPVETVQVFLERIERIDSRIGSYVTVTAERALVKAKEAEQAILARDARELGPLHGVPIAVKDLTPTAGVRTTLGSRAFEQWVPDADSPEVARVFAAGAILLGKTNTPELGLSMTTESDLFPPTRNPWDLASTPGGSSGGSGAALAARLCPLATGTDAGGSVRIPASACGVVGLKPSRGRVIPEPFTYAALAGFASSGPMAHTVADVALLLESMSVPPAMRPASLVANRTDPSAPLRIGWTATSPATPVSDEVRAAVEATARLLAELGHDVREDAPETSGLLDPFFTIVAAHTVARPMPDAEKLGPNAQYVIEIGSRLSAADYLRAEFARLDVHQRVMEWFRRFDIFLCPTLPTVPPPREALIATGQEHWDRMAEFGAFNYWVNMTGQPAISLPLGVSAEGLPIGVQLIGRPHADELLLALSARLEEAMPWADRIPPVANE